MDCQYAVRFRRSNECIFSCSVSMLQYQYGFVFLGSADNALFRQGISGENQQNVSVLPVAG